MIFDTAKTLCTRYAACALAITFAVGCATQGSQTSSYDDLSFHGKAIAGEKNSQTADQGIAEDSDTTATEDALSAAESATGSEQGNIQIADDTGCDKVIIAMSQGAVGNPCMTTRDFMAKELGFNDKKIDEVMAMATKVGIAH